MWPVSTAREVTSATVSDVDETSPEPGRQPQPEPGEEHGFRVHLDNFEGPFDLLLGLISKHKLDITEVSLHKVTDDFIAHIHSYGRDWDLDQASHFLLVAATLLDLKAARLLPSGEVDDEEDLALLEARDLLFARLLQYRAYKEVAKVFAGRIADASRRFPRVVPMEPRFANLLPEVLLGLGPEEFARLAARAFTPREAPSVSVEHIYQPKASVTEQAAIVVERLRRLRNTTFRVLASDAEGTYEVVARFLALLELYRDQNVMFEQLEPLGELHITWTGTDEGEVEVGDDYEGVAKKDDADKDKDDADKNDAETRDAGTDGAAKKDEKEQRDEGGDD
ncbi:segregation/condensation protein A [Actinomadura sp. 6K520]|nr:segregation/condensation protein A [Actinomadura sp. 6K520]